LYAFRCTGIRVGLTGTGNFKSSTYMDLEPETEPGRGAPAPEKKGGSSSTTLIKSAELSSNVGSL